MGVIKKDKAPGSKAALVYGQMNEPPGARARVALTGLTVAEYFRDEEGQDVLLFVDNIFRSVGPNSECGRLSANSSDGSGVSAGTHYYDPEGIDHVGAGCLCPCRRLDRSCASDDFRALGRDYSAVTSNLRVGNLPGGRPAGFHI